MSSRRSVLAGVAGAFGLAGCLDGSDLEAGDLSIDNRTDADQTVEVRLEKHGEGDDAIPDGADRAAANDSTPLSERTFQYDVPAGERTRKSQFVEQPGTYFVDASVVGSDDRGWEWVTYSASSAGDLAGRPILVDVPAIDRLTVSAPYDD